jgi:hypothetical protein
MINRLIRTLKLRFIAVIAVLLSAAAGGWAATRPIVGAIRWDGWYGEGFVVKQTETSLGQPKYHFRLPWFARVVGEGKVSIREAIEWTAANRDLNPANALIIYAWNEHDEGGWLQPTLGSDGRPNEERIQALGKVLRSLPFKPETSKP